MENFTVEQLFDDLQNRHEDWETMSKEERAEFVDDLNSLKDQLQDMIDDLELLEPDEDLSLDTKPLGHTIEYNGAIIQILPSKHSNLIIKIMRSKEEIKLRESQCQFGSVISKSQYEAFQRQAKSILEMYYQCSLGEIPADGIVIINADGEDEETIIENVIVIVEKNKEILTQTIS